MGMEVVFDTAARLIGLVQQTQCGNIRKAAELIADSFMAGGILQAFGSGHSNAGARELCGRAGGFVPTKEIVEPAGGRYETVQGVGEIFMQRVDIRKDDTVFIISNSGRNPLPIEIALESKRRGAHVVAVTSVKASAKLTSKHQSGKHLFEVADVVIDNCVPDGDCCIHLDGLDTAICGMSSITTAAALQAVTYEAARVLLERGAEVPVLKSQNIDGGPEWNEALRAKYFDRLHQ